jgi:hypothetical protein
MRVAKDYTGYTFGQWTVLHRDTDRVTKYWVCRCSCGTVKSVCIDNLKGGTSLRCQKCKGELSRKRMTTHGESKTKLYYVWLTMRNRCYRSEVKGYERYGGRGITVCEEWRKSYESFRDWAMDNGYREGLEIDRVDNDGNYEPSNCRWVTRLENMQNTRINKKVFYHGKIYTRTELADNAHLSRRLVGERLRKGWSVEETLHYNPVVGNNQTLRRKHNGK